MRIVRLGEHKRRHDSPCGTLVVSGWLVTFLLVVSVHILLGRLGQYETHGHRTERRKPPQVESKNIFLDYDKILKRQAKMERTKLDPGLSLLCLPSDTPQFPKSRVLREIF